jgi:hypothetical protein
MRRIIIIGMTLLALPAVSATGASAHVLTAGVVPTLLLLSAEGPQIFTTLTGTVECNVLAGHGFDGAKVTETLKVTVSYSSCLTTIVGGGASVKPTEPINADYELNANGTVTILAPITITAVVGVRCTVVIPAQGPLSSTSFGDKGTKEVLVSAKITGIQSSDAGTGCKELYANSKTGTYNGRSVILADGTGPFKWE